MGENPPQFVTCNCQHCDGHIEFDANEFAEENSIVPCPHCGSETKLFIPVSIPAQLPNQPSSKPSAPDTTPIVSRFEGFLSGTSEIKQEGIGDSYPVVSKPKFTEEQIKSVGKRSNDDLAKKLLKEGEQDMALSFEDARRYIADPRFKLMNPETGIRFTPATLEAFIKARQLKRNAEKNEVKQTEAQLDKCWQKYNKLKEQLMKERSKSKLQRVSLTSAQCEIPVVQELISLLVEIEKGGFIADDGARRLNAWLALKNNSEIPAFHFLLNISKSVLAIGELNTRTTPELMIALELQVAIERVLPKHIREPIVARRKEIEERLRNNVPADEDLLDRIHELGGNPPKGITAAEAYELKEELYHQPTDKQLAYIRALGVNPPPDLTRYTAIELIENLLHSVKATESQLQYLRDLGITPPVGLSQSAASELIQQRLGKQQPTPRQMMILRFWNRMELSECSKEEVASWLEQFYNENPRRKEAWEAFKQETGDDGSQHDPSTVPIGVGESYMRCK